MAVGMDVGTEVDGVEVKAVEEHVMPIRNKHVILGRVYFI
jgi:hypothetical protein